MCITLMGFLWDLMGAHGFPKYMYMKIIDYSGNHLYFGVEEVGIPGPGL